MAAAQADTYLTWGEPPAQVAEKIAAFRQRAASRGRTLRYGIRLHLIVRETEGEAWDAARCLIRHLSDDTIATAQRKLATESDSEGRRRMLALHGGSRERLEVAPNLWAGVGLVRGGAGTALMSDPAIVAERIREYQTLGIDTMIGSGYPQLEEAYRVAELLFPLLDVSRSDAPARKSGTYATCYTPQPTRPSHSRPSPPLGALRSANRRTSMTLEFIGMIQPREQSETHPARGPAIDPGYLVASAQAHEAHMAEDGGFDRVLVGWFSNGPDGLQIAAHAAAHTKQVGFLVAHRPGFQAPTTAARAFATLDQLSGGRAAIHVISGGDDQDQARDGDWLGKDDRYARTDEYVEILKQVWTADGPADHHGAYYRIQGASPAVQTVQRPRIPIYFGGASDAALRVAGKHADVYALWGETRAQVAEIIGRVRAEAAKHGRQVRFSLSFRPILGATEAEAWARAEAILARTLEVRGEAALGPAQGGPANAGSQRLLAAAALGDRPEGRLYTAIARVTGARGNTTALVGTPQQVAEAFLDYYALGVTTFLIRGFDPLEDALEYGRTLLPLTRRLLAERTQHQTAAE